MNSSTKKFQRIFGTLQPWEFWMNREILVEFRRRTDGKRLGEPVVPDATGAFVIDLKLTSELAKSLRSGSAELHAVDREGRLLGIEHLPATEQQLISVKIGIKARKPDAISVAHNTLAMPEIITLGARRELAEQVAKLSSVETSQAKAPQTVLNAIADLNEMSILAMQLRNGRKEAVALMSYLLKDICITRQEILDEDTVPLAEGEFAAMTAKVEFLPESPFPGRGCITKMPRVLEVMQAAFALDFVDKNKEPKWTMRAGAYIRQRLQIVESFSNTVRKTISRGGVNFPNYPGEPEDLIIPPSEREFPSDEGIVEIHGRIGFPEPEPDPFPNFNWSDFCEMIPDICIGLFEAAVAATLNDQYLDLIASVEPNCLCSEYDPKQEFIAKPASGRAFPDPLPSGVQLHFGKHIITPHFVSSKEIRFRIPPNSRSGSVYLRMFGLVDPSVASRDFSRVCGKTMPELPNVILFNPGPSAFLSIIYPPKIAALTANRQSGEIIAESCRPVNICWQTHLSDQSAGDLIWPCGSIQLTVTEIIGGEETQIVDTTSLSGCISVAAREDRRYEAQAISYAGVKECKPPSDITELLIRRVPHINLSILPNQTNEVLSGSDGRFVAQICRRCSIRWSGDSAHII